MRKAILSNNTFLASGFQVHLMIQAMAATNFILLYSGA